ncbi:hypothetical protein M514_01777 [Trichuris suis]|uniref:Uncharacterized protein n=1 Tax=Trichuris suis TaxID=68888 RepID=A0A085NT61_9BILA|nr:hypothetical protein M513_01777 [Trichuris suis]KFD72657.1 hypothetical protein M514_01777 [Trichuris suis]
MLTSVPLHPGIPCGPEGPGRPINPGMPAVPRKPGSPWAPSMRNQSLSLEKFRHLCYLLCSLSRLLVHVRLVGQADPSCLQDPLLP